MPLTATVRVDLKSSVLDPQGSAVAKSLRTLGYGEVADVRVGRVMELTLDTDDPVAARERVEAMCEQLLANTVIESYRIEVA